MLAAFCLASMTIAWQPPSDEKVLKVFRDEFIEISPGAKPFFKSFQMGSNDGPEAERPAHQVSFPLKYSFWIAKYEVPQNLWSAVMGNNPSRWKGPRNSVEMLSRSEAREFCNKATVRMRELELIAADEVIRLPSEAEWEYVARARTETRYSFGDSAERLGEFAWFNGNAKGNDPPVGAKKPNPWNLFDVHGYLWEWCEDDWHASYMGAPSDGSSWKSEDDSKGVCRGGSWKDNAEFLTSTYRRSVPADLRDDAVGLRCVLSKSR